MCGAASDRMRALRMRRVVLLNRPATVIRVAIGLAILVDERATMRSVLMVVF
jgi:hypothetical protein